MIDVSRETLRLLSKAAADVPGRPHSATVVRWAGRGVRGARLATVVVGGRRYTSLEAIQRFLKALNEPGAVAPAPPSERRRREIAAAERRLDAEKL